MTMKTILAAACVAATQILQVTATSPCGGGAAFPWCDHTMAVDKRVASLISNLTDDEKSKYAPAPSARALGHTLPANLSAFPRAPRPRTLRGSLFGLLRTVSLFVNGAGGVPRINWPK